MKAEVCEARGLGEAIRAARDVDRRGRRPRETDMRSLSAAPAHGAAAALLTSEPTPTVAIDPITRVLCIALLGWTALAAGEYCDWLSAAGASAIVRESGGEVEDELVAEGGGCDRPVDLRGSRT